MGKMPVERESRWKSIFRRYGIGSATEADTSATNDALDKLAQGAQDALIPGKSPLPGTDARQKKASDRRAR